MTDKLVFPANDTLSMMGDLTSNMMSEEVLAHDINPSFPQTEGSINIPEIIPPMISPKGTANAFKPTADQSYTPIGQLMKQTEELTATLDGPLNANINEPMNFNHMQGNSTVSQESILGQHMPNPLVNNSINFVNPNSHSPLQTSQNTQCLVIGGQRIPISAQNQHSSSVINIKHATNTSSPLIQTCTPHAMHSSSSSTNTNSNNIKQTMVVKAPGNQSTQNPNKPPMKGQIIKTPDQRLMFVTEVNGRRVGYLIQQPKQTNVAQTPVTQVPTPATQSVLNQHFDNRNIQEDSSISNDSAAVATSMDKQKTSEPINFTLDENKEIIMTHSENVTKVAEPLLKTDMKSLREKLSYLRNPNNAKTPLNLKTLAFPSISKPEEKAATDDGMEVDKPDSPASSNDSMTSGERITEILTTQESKEIPLETDIDYNDIEEEGQEIEFSENDLTAEFDENAEEQPNNTFEDNDIQDRGPEDPRSRKTSTDDEDCMPLSRLLNDNEGSNSPLEEMIQPVNIDKPKKGKNSKKVKQTKETQDSSSKKELIADGVDSKSKKKGKGKPKKKKDNRKPKKPTIAYQLFFRDAQKDVRAEDPELTFGEISRVVSKKWEMTDEAGKKKYHDIYEVAKVEYDKKMIVYKELIAQEECSTPPSPSSPLQPELAEEVDDISLNDKNEIQGNTLPKKTKAKRGRKRKIVVKAPDAKTVFDFDEKKDELDSSMEFNEHPNETAHEEEKIVKKVTVKKQLKTNDKTGLDNPPSSPSLPSSASSDEEDSESAITRIREKAAELHKYLKQQRIVVTQKKAKQAGKKLRSEKDIFDIGEDGGDELIKSDGRSEVESTDVADDVTADVNEAAHQNHKLKIRVKEVKEDDGDDEDEGTDTADETKDMIVHDATSNGIQSFEEEVIKDGKGKKNVKKEDVEKEDVEKEDVEKEDVEKEDWEKEDEEEDDVDELSDDEKVSISKRKKSTRIKKLEETTVKGKQKTTSRLRKRKTIKTPLEDTPKSESDEESLPVTRKKSTRKKNLDDITQSDDEEGINDFPEGESEIASEKLDAKDPALDSDDDDEEMPNIDEAKINTVEAKDKTLDTPQTEESKSPVSPPETTLKNTFRIPKKSGANNENGILTFRGPRICIRESCEKPAVISRERGGQYCGNECLVLFCREVFDSWVTDRQMEEKSKT